jgi:ribulose-phosphate 3-epimerase
MISRKEIKIAASMACADFWRLEEQVRTLEKAKVDILHCDIMDGNFVPNFSLFPDFVTTLKENASIPVEVHMQIVNPERFIETFIDAGADSICFHIETIHNVHRIIQQIKLYGIRVGVSLNPSTHPAVVEYVLSEVDFLTVMAVDKAKWDQEASPKLCTEERLLLETRLARLNSQLSMMTKGDPDYQDIEKEFFEIAGRLRRNHEP